MDSLKLSKEEEGYLAELLDGAISDLRAEIAHTDSPSFKEHLRERKEALKRIAARIHKLLPTTAE